MYNGNDVREPYQALSKWADDIGPEEFQRRREEAEALFRRIGITFAVYGEGGYPERLIPFDLMPSVFTNHEWNKLERIFA